MKIATLRNSLLAAAGIALTAASTSFAGPVVSTTPVPPPAPAGGGFYFSIHGGALWLEDASAYGIDLDFDTGISVLGAVGYSFGNGLAVELESGYLGVDSGEASSYGLRGDVEGEFRQVPIFANVIYTIDLTERLGIYVGGGAGLVWSDSEVDSAGGYKVSISGGDEWNFAAQAKAGVSFKVTEAASLNVATATTTAATPLLVLMTPRAPSWKVASPSASKLLRATSVAQCGRSISWNWAFHSAVCVFDQISCKERSQGRSFFVG